MSDVEDNDEFVEDEFVEGGADEVALSDRDSDSSNDDEGSERSEDDNDNEEDEDELPSAGTIKEIILPQDKFIYSECLSLAEQAMLISMRAKQINDTGTTFVDSEYDNAIQIATQELVERRCPLMVVRKSMPKTLANGEIVVYVEEWDPNRMILKRTYD